MSAAGMVRRNKRYIVWFFLLNLLFAHFGANAFSTHVHAILDHSLYSDRMLHGFDPTVFLEMLFRPDFGPLRSSSALATIFAVLFLVASIVFMPGVLLGYSYDHRISRNEFFRACSQNLWRFVRLFLIYAVIAGLITAILFGVQAGAAHAAERSLDERVPILVQFVGLVIIFLIMTSVRIWFDLAQTRVVLQDQTAVRKTLRPALRMTRQHIGHLLGSYVVISIAALVVFVAGIWLWHSIVPASSVLGAFLISEAMMLVLLGMRFWQRAVAVAFYLDQQMEAAEVAISSRTTAIANV